jgi:hypothetical protein
MRDSHRPAAKSDQRAQGLRPFLQPGKRHNRIGNYTIGEWRGSYASAMPET